MTLGAQYGTHEVTEQEEGQRIDGASTWKKFIEHNGWRTTQVQAAGKDTAAPQTT